LTSPNHEQLEQIFTEALAIVSMSERKAFLDRQCGSDRELRLHVTGLLKAHQQVGSFLDTPPVDLHETRDFGKLDESAGTKIGRYKIIDKIGEGGFGSVFMAEQEEPVRRMVALKIIKLGMDTKEVIARFEAERQALALMDHPNIARVFDAGATDTGRPFFVMELVRGVSINKYCDEHRLTTRQRLELFLDVCHAVQHAHQKGIIHRDLKPTNVLVTMQEDKAIPKVIDFGIAKATSHRLTEKTLYTGFREFVGTPEYMSPDQAELNGANVDTRTDIYSLGVLLYEILTSGRPFDGEMLNSASLADILRVIREVEPPKPSTRWLVPNNAQELTELAQHHRSEPRALMRRIRGDLDWIVMKAMEKNRSRRYATAKDLADDVERHLQHLPITASAPGIAYKCRKFIRRHRAAVLTGSIAVVALIGGFALATIGLIQANSARAALKIESEAAKQAQAGAEATNSFLQQMLASVDPDRALGREVTVRYMLDEAAKRIEEGALIDQPEVEASVRMTLGETYEGLGAYETAEAHLSTASDILHSRLGERHPSTLRAQRSLAGILRVQGKFAAAESLLRRTADLQAEISGNSHPDTLASLTELARALWGPGRFEEAESIHRSTLAIQRKVLGDAHPDTIESMIHLGGVNRALGRFDQAEPLLREALQLCRRVRGEEHPQTAVAMNSLGLLLESQRSYGQAEELYRKTYGVDQHILGADHPHTLVSMNNLLRVLDAQGKSAERVPLIRDRLGQLARAANRADASPSDLHDYAWELLNSESVDLRDHASALPMALRAVDLDGRRNANLLETLATAHRLNGNLDHAITAQREALEKARLGGVYNRAAIEAKLVNYLIENGDLVGATAVSWNNLASRLGRTLLSGETPGTSLIAQANKLMAEGRSAEAAAVLRGCLAIRQKEMLEGHWLIADTQSQLGAALAADGKFREAEPLLLEAHDALKDNRRVPLAQQRLAIQRIIRLYESWNNPEQVSKWRRRLTGDVRAEGPPNVPVDTRAGAMILAPSIFSTRRDFRGKPIIGPPMLAGLMETTVEDNFERDFEHQRGRVDRTRRRPQRGTSIGGRRADISARPPVENEERQC
jgi:tetratricopeptide (TPR) repeat protein